MQIPTIISKQSCDRTSPTNVRSTAPIQQGATALSIELRRRHNEESYFCVRQAVSKSKTLDKPRYFFWTCVTSCNGQSNSASMF